MSQEDSLPSEMLNLLKTFDTPTICNAIEKLKIRLRNEGYLTSKIICRNPLLASMVGYAVTVHMRTANPPLKGQSYADKDDLWKYLLTLPAPRVVVIQDMDDQIGTGAVMGVTHAAILQSLGCVGIVTNGAIRYLPTLQDMGLHLYAGCLSPSHAYAHIIDFGMPVKIGGLQISSGDLVHGDIHGLVSIPPDHIHQIIQNSQKIIHNKEKVMKFCQTKGHSLKDLEIMLEEFK